MLHTYRVEGMLADALDCTNTILATNAKLLSALLSHASLLNGQSSPGNLQVGHVASKSTRQIPHRSSSSLTSQRQAATAVQDLMVTFIIPFPVLNDPCVPSCALRQNLQSTKFPSPISDETSCVRTTRADRSEISPLFMSADRLAVAWVAGDGH